MLGDHDLLGDDPSVRRSPVLAVLRRATALLLVAALTATTLVAADALRGGRVTSVARAEARGADPGRDVAAATTTPSALVARALGVPWVLLELSLRPDRHAVAVMSARFEGPRGTPAVPDRLLAVLADPALAGLVPVAITATAAGTAVEVAGPVPIDTTPVSGAAVPGAELAGRVSAAIVGAGATVRAVRRVDDGASDGVLAVAVSLDGSADAVVAALRALEQGPSAPTRMTTLLVRRSDSGVAVELVLTAREARRAST